MMNLQDDPGPVRGWVVFFLSATWCLLTFSVLGCAPPVAKVKNVVLIGVGNVRPDHLSIYGAERSTDPRLSRLASRGVVFEEVYTGAPSPSVGSATVLSGHFAAVHGLTSFGRSLRQGVPLLSETLSEAGFETVAFVGESRLHPAMGFSRGFDGYFDCTGNEEIDFDDPRAIQIDPEVLMRFRRATERTTNEGVTSTFVEWLDGRDDPDRPFFSWINYADPAPLFLAPQNYVEEMAGGYHGALTGDIRDPRVRPTMDPFDLDHLRDLYDAELKWTDAHVGYCLDRLHQHGLLRETLVVFYSTYGQPFLEHDRKIPGSGVHEYDVRVPLVWVTPDAWALNGDDPSESPPELGGKKQRRISGVVSLASIAPTVLDALGLPVPSGSLSPSLWGVIDRGDSISGDGFAFFESSLGQANRVFGMRIGTTKVMRRPNGGRYSIFDVGGDPGEKIPTLVRSGEVDGEPRVKRLVDFDDLLVRYGQLWDESELSIPQEFRDKLASYGIEVAGDD